MSCYSCDNAEICVISDFVKQHSLIANIEISGCKKYIPREKYNSKLKNEIEALKEKVSEPTTGVMQITPPVNISNDPGVLFKQPLDFTQASNALREQQKTQVKDKAHTQITVVPKEEPGILVSCNSCHTETYDSDITLCAECGKEVCPSCSSENPEDHKTICDDCFDKK